MNGAGLLTVPSATRAAAEHKAFCLKVRATFGAGGHAESLLPFRDVVAVVASSRGGSSLLFDLLRSSGAFLCLDGEHSTLYKLYGFGLPTEPAAHDGTVAPGADAAGFLLALASDVTTGNTGGPRPRSAGEFATRAVRMLSQQWAECPLAPQEAWEVICGAAARLLAAGTADPDRLLLAAVAALRERGWPIDPWYFDLSPGLVRATFPGLPPPQGPPAALTQTLEAPPFLVPAAAAPPGRGGPRRPLLLKASMDAYRLPLLRTLFPGARLRVIHLTRNPAAAVNGLIDGWLHHGFFSHNLAGRATFGIDGYGGPWAGSWWNFDLPPGWQDVVTQPLATVCAAQWASAHTSILAGLAGQDWEVLRVRAEDVFDSDRRPAALRRVFRFCGVRPLAPVRARIVVATAPPVPGRWRGRRAMIEPAVAEPRVRETSVLLGYGPVPTRQWT
jgi:hypothetical protein